MGGKQTDDGTHITLSINELPDGCPVVFQRDTNIGRHTFRQQPTAHPRMPETRISQNGTPVFPLGTDVITMYGNGIQQIHAGMDICTILHRTRTD